jgi:hypothetical protein
MYIPLRHHLSRREEAEKQAAAAAEAAVSTHHPFSLPLFLSLYSALCTVFYGSHSVTLTLYFVHIRLTAVKISTLSAHTIRPPLSPPSPCPFPLVSQGQWGQHLIEQVRNSLESPEAREVRLLDAASEELQSLLQKLESKHGDVSKLKAKLEEAEGVAIGRAE